jgi:CubicO group peptidase (beta-lactamase class C family)
VSGRGISVAVLRDFELVRVHSEGLADDAVLQVGSISKPVAALVALTLAERGALDLDADVNGALTSWHVPGEVTLRQLLSHTGGMTVESFPGHPAGAPMPTLGEVLAGSDPSNTDPVEVDAEARGTYRYSGGGYAIVQQLVEDVTRETFADVAYELVFVPLGMRDSSFVQELPDALRRRAVRGYRGEEAVHRGEEAVQGGWHVYPAAAAAGLWTTARDLATFSLALQCALVRRQSPVSRRTAVAMLSPQAEVPAREEWEAIRALGVEPPQEMGLGLFLSADGTRFGHLGSNAGFTAALDASVADGSGAVVTSNSDGDFGRVLSTLAASI